MNLETYLSGLTPDERIKFAEDAGTTVGFLDHLVSGRKHPAGIEKILSLIKASGGELSLRGLRPDLFSDSRIGKENIELLRQATG